MSVDSPACCFYDTKRTVSRKPGAMVCTQLHACLLGPFGNNMDDHQLRESVDQSRSTSNAVDGCVGVEAAIAA